MAKADVQRAKVYRWERAHIPHVWRDPLTAAGAQVLVDRISATYLLPKVTLVIKKIGGYTQGHYAHWTNTVTIDSRTGMNRGVVLHEMAHAVCANWKRQLGQAVNDGGHGDFFMAAYLDVLAKCSDLSQEDLARVRASLDPLQVTDSRRRRSLPKVAACQVYDDPKESPEQARRSMRCMYCNYPWIRHDMPFHKHECAERWLSLEGHQDEVVKARNLGPSARRQAIVTMVRAATAHLGWHPGGRGWVPLSNYPLAMAFRPTIADHVSRPRGSKA